MVDQLIEHLAEQGDRPWFVHLSLLRPHPPWVAPEPYNALYDPASLPGFVREESAEREGEQHPWLRFHLSRSHFRAPEDERQLRRLKASYFGLDERGGPSARPALRLARGAGACGTRRSSSSPPTTASRWATTGCSGRPATSTQSYHVPLIVRDPRRGSDGPAAARRTPSPRTSTCCRRSSSGSAPRCRPSATGARCSRSSHEARAPEGWRREAHFEFDFREHAGRGARAQPRRAAPRVRAERAARTSATSTSTSPALPPCSSTSSATPRSAATARGDPAYLPARARVRAAHALLAPGPRRSDAHPSGADAGRRLRAPRTRGGDERGQPHDVPELARGPRRRGAGLGAGRGRGSARACRSCAAPLEVLQFPGGHANLTYLLRFGTPRARAAPPALRAGRAGRPRHGARAQGAVAALGVPCDRRRARTCSARTSR